MQRRVGDDAAAADVFGLQLELGFDQGEDHSRWSYQLEGVRQDQSQRDEGDVDHAKVDRLGNVGAREVAGVQMFAHDHARIVADFPGELAVADVDRVNLRRAALQEAIGEAAGGRADVERGHAGGIDREMIERAFEFQSAAADIFRRRGDDEFGVGRDFDGGFVQDAIAEADFAGHDGALRLLAAREMPLLDQDNIEARLFCHHPRSSRSQPLARAQTSSIAKRRAATARSNCSVRDAERRHQDDRIADRTRQEPVRARARQTAAPTEPA